MMSTQMVDGTSRGTHAVLDDGANTRHEEISPQLVQSILHSLMARAVGAQQHLRQAQGRGGDEDAVANGDEVIDDCPLAAVASLLDLMAQSRHCRIRGELAMQFIVQLEGGHQ
jgi:hypothetical protein